MANWIVILICVAFIPNLGKSATRCYQCSSATNPQCTYPLNTDLPNQCTNTTAEIACAVYRYKTTDNEEHVSRECRSKTETCQNIEDGLNGEHKQHVECFLCFNDLCNNITSDTSRGSKISKSNRHEIHILFVTFCMFLVTRH